MKINYIGIKDGKFCYEVELNGHKFDYSTGLGFIVKGRLTRPEDCASLSVEDSAKVMSTWTLLEQNAFRDKYLWNGRIYRKIPNENDVLECLRNDVEAGNYSFADFCDNFGYSSDSIRALDVYRACMDTAQKLQGFSFPS